MENSKYLKQLAERIKAARKKQGISQEKLAALCKTDKSNMWFIEKGVRNPRLLTLKSIADVLKMDVKDFL